MTEEGKDTSTASGSENECVGQATLNFLAAVDGYAGLIRTLHWSDEARWPVQQSEGADKDAMRWMFHRIWSNSARRPVDRNEDADKVTEREARILDAFNVAFAQEPDAAMRALFYARDVRGGLGERRLFRLILGDLANTCPEVVRRNLPLVAEYGRWDDLLELLGTPCEMDMVKEIKRQLDADIRANAEGGEVSLLAKWLPSINASSPRTKGRAKRLCEALRMSQKVYRKALSALRGKIDLMENRLRKGDMDFAYEEKPSAALHKYRGALQRRDGHRYRQFLWDTRLAQARISSGPFAPYEIVNTCLKGQHTPLSPAQCQRLDATWRSLPDFFEGAGQSMVVLLNYTGPAIYLEKSDVATRGRVYEGAAGLSLAFYFAERMKGYFHNRVLAQMTEDDIQFMDVDIQGITGNVARYYLLQRFLSFDNSACLRKIYSLLLTTALRYRLPQEELPDRLYVISDSYSPKRGKEDAAATVEAKALFAERGYRAPKLIAWDMNAGANGKESEDVSWIIGNRPQEYLRAISGLCDRAVYLRTVLNCERYRPVSGRMS